MRHRVSVTVLAVLATTLLAACSGGGSNDIAGPENTVEIILAGSQAGRVVDGGNYIDCPSVTCGPLDWSPGLLVQLTATADSGSSFVSWSGDCTTTNGNVCEFVVNGHMVVTATFSTP